MKLVAVKTFTYGGRRLAIGDAFDAANSRDAKILVAIRNARQHEDERPEVKIPTPDKALIDRVSFKQEQTAEPTKPEPVKTVKTEEKSDEKDEESKDSEKDEPAKEAEKPTIANVIPKRTYN